DGTTVTGGRVSTCQRYINYKRGYLKQVNPFFYIVPQSIPKENFFFLKSRIFHFFTVLCKKILNS
ncbi:MAG: hypothetical protein EAZ97_16015, partial [Bacteroidetes bacterium]